MDDSNIPLWEFGNLGKNRTGALQLHSVKGRVNSSLGPQKDIEGAVVYDVLLQGPVRRGKSD